MKMENWALVSLILQGQKMQKVSCSFYCGLFNSASQNGCVAEMLPAYPLAVPGQHVFLLLFFVCLFYFLVTTWQRVDPLKVLLCIKTAIKR